MPRRGRHLRAPCVSAAAAAAAAAALLVCLAGACDLARAVAGEAAAAAAAGECADAEAASDAAAVWSRVAAALSSAAATSPRGENIARVSGARLLSAAGEPSGRPYHLVLFLSSEGQLTQAQAKLVRLARQQFALVASSYKAQSALAGGREAGQHNSARGDSEAATAARAALGGARLHFLELMFEDAPEVFSALRVKSVPFVAHIAPIETLTPQRPPDAASTSSRDRGRLFFMGDVRADTQLQLDAEGIARYIEARTGARVALQKPRVFDETWFAAARAAFAVLATGAALQTLSAGVLADKRLWLMGLFALYFFTVSGGWWCLIKGAPLLIRIPPELNDDGTQVDPSAETQIEFYAGREAQLGIEGYSAGALYAAFGTGVAALAHYVPWVRTARGRRALGYGALALSTWAATELVEWYSWKRGEYSPRIVGLV